MVEFVRFVRDYFDVFCGARLFVGAWAEKCAPPYTLTIAPGWEKKLLTWQPPDDLKGQIGEKTQFAASLADFRDSLRRSRLDRPDLVICCTDGDLHEEAVGDVREKGLSAFRHYRERWAWVFLTPGSEAKDVAADIAERVNVYDPRYRARAVYASAAELRNSAGRSKLVSDQEKG